MASPGPRRLSALPTRARPPSHRLQEVLFSFKVASHPVRLQILLIVSRKAMEFREICESFEGLGSPSASQHLGALRRGVLIKLLRREKCKVYVLTEGGSRLLQALTRISPRLITDLGAEEGQAAPDASWPDESPIEPGTEHEMASLSPRSASSTPSARMPGRNPGPAFGPWSPRDQRVRE